MDLLRSSPTFLLGFPRSGTTLLQRMLNAHPRLTLWGEHEGFLAPLAESYLEFQHGSGANRLANEPAQYEKLIGPYKDDGKPIFWHNSLDRPYHKEQHRLLIENLFTKGLPEGHFWGFKEIRYGQKDRVVPMLAELFESGRFVFLFRQPREAIFSAISVWHRDALEALDRDTLKSRLAGYKQRWLLQNRTLHDHLRQHARNRSFYVCYEQLIATKRVAWNLIAFLGLEWDDRVLAPLGIAVNARETKAADAVLEEIICREDLSELDALHDELRAAVNPKPGSVPAIPIRRAP